MKRFFAIIAILLAVGFLNGGNAVSAHQMNSVVVEIEATNDQFFVAADSESHHEDEKGCCWDSLCFSANHCHHAGGSGAFLSFADTVTGPVTSSAFEATSDSVRALALTYLLIDPPRA